MRDTIRALVEAIDPYDGVEVDHRDAQRWLPTGGHVDPGEHPTETARREMNEELGIAPPFHHHVGRAPFFVTVTRSSGLSEPHTDVSLWYVFEAARDVAITADEREFAGARWWPFADIRSDGTDKFDENLPRFVRKLQRSLGVQR